MAEIKDQTIRIISEPPTVDIKSKQASPDNSGNIVLNPPTASLTQKRN